jgi:hypothetical protein
LIAVRRAEEVPKGQDLVIVCARSGEPAPPGSSSARPTELVAGLSRLLPGEEEDSFAGLRAFLTEVKGEILAKSNPSDPESIEDCFTRSLACARRQSALSLAG